MYILEITVGLHSSRNANVFVCVCFDSPKTVKFARQPFECVIYRPVSFSFFCCYFSTELKEYIKRAMHFACFCFSTTHRNASCSWSVCIGRERMHAVGLEAVRAKKNNNTHIHRNKNKCKQCKHVMLHAISIARSFVVYFLSIKIVLLEYSFILRHISNE